MSTDDTTIIMSCLDIIYIDVIKISGNDDMKVKRE